MSTCRSKYNMWSDTNFLHESLDINIDLRDGKNCYMIMISMIELKYLVIFSNICNI